MKEITSSIYEFEELIRENYLYVDKTEYIWNLIRPGLGGYFLSRPHCFGKSLTISTLKAIFEGKKELFKGLAIYDKPYDWTPHPVIHLDFADLSPTINTPEELKNYFISKVDRIAAEFSVNLTMQSPGMRLGQLIRKLHENKKEGVVVLVDGYDRPIINNYFHPNLEAIYNALIGFLCVLKSECEHERFVLVTGATKFFLTTYFFGFNNLEDISTHCDCATMFGYTQEELEKYFAEHIDLACKKLDMPREELLQKVQDWYGGFRFEGKSETVYNPVSLAEFFNHDAKFSNYWLSANNLTFWVELMRQSKFDIEQALAMMVSNLTFHPIEVGEMDPVTLLLQTGHLTIKSTEEKYNTTWYRLGFTNREAKDSFDNYLK